MALAEEAMIDAQTAVRIVTAAVQTDWDRDFTANDKIKGWLLEQVQRVPFDPNTVTLLDYVKSRMAAAEQQQKQQQVQQPPAQPQPVHYQQQQQQQHYQQQQQQYQAQQQQYFHQQRESSQPTQPFSQSQTSSTYQQQHPISQFNHAPSQSPSSSYTTTAQPVTNGVEYTLLSDDESSGHQSEEDQPYQFDLSDFAEPSKAEATAFNSTGSSTSARPQQQHQHNERPLSQHFAASPATMFPYSTGHPAQPLPVTQPFSQTSATPQRTFYHHESLPVSQPMGLNPALLLNNQSRQMQQPQVISPHQLTQQNGNQVSGLSLAPTASTSASVSPAPVASTSSNNNSKAKRRSEVEVVVMQRSQGGTANGSAKRKKVAAAATPDSSKQPLSATAATQQKQQAQQSGSSAPQLNSILQITPNTLPPPSEAQQIWNEIRKEMEKCLHQACRSPHKTVMKMFKLLSPFVSEPPDATTRQGTREAFITELRVPAEARLAILDVIRDETNDDFDVIFVVDPRATTLLHEWTKDLAMIAKGKYNGPEPAEEIKKTSRSLMAVFQKLPISLDVLQTLKGVGKDVATLSRSDAFDEVTKDNAKVLVQKWKALIGKAGAGPSAPRRATTPSAPAASTVSKKRADFNGPTSADDEESRKKRRVSPSTSSASKPASAPTTTPKSTAPTERTAVSATSAAAKGSGTQPLGRLPTTIKPTTGKVLPSFAKRKSTTAAQKPAPAVTPKPAAAPAVAAAFDPFALSLSHMAASKESAAGVGMSVGDTLSMLNKAMDATSGKAPASNIPRPGQSKKKSVRWAEEDKLNMIKVVEKLVYGDEFGNEITTSDYFNTTGETVGEHEGVAMKGLVEQMDWEEPLLVDRKLSQDELDLMVEYPHPELIETGKCERDVQAEREKTTLAPTYLSEEEVPLSPAEPTADTSAPSIPAVAEPVIMRLGHDLLNDAAVQLSIYQAQMSRSLPPVQGAGLNTANLQAGQQGNPYSAPSNTSMYAPPATQPEMPLAVAGADLNSLLAQLSGSGLAASLNTAPSVPPHMQHNQAPSHQYSHLQQYSQPYQQRY